MVVLMWFDRRQLSTDDEQRTTEHQHPGRRRAAASSSRQQLSVSISPVLAPILAFALYGECLVLMPRPLLCWRLFAFVFAH